METEILGGALHPLPDDLKVTLIKNVNTLAAWQSLTALARNEWICWITSAKQIATRNKRINQTLIKLNQGKKDLVAGLDAPTDNYKIIAWWITIY